MRSGIRGELVDHAAARAAFSSPNGTLNSLSIPANYRGTINIRVTSGSLVRNFRIVVRR